jgi:cation transport ATPase
MMHVEPALPTLSQAEGQEACCTSQRTHESHTMKHNHHEGHHGSHSSDHHVASLNRTAIMATLHCLTGCTIGEILGMVLGTAFGWSNWSTVALAVILAFAFGYAMTLWPLRKSGMAWGVALGLAFASDTLSMATMEFVDNAIMLVIPGAMDAGLGTALFWGSLTVSLLVAGIAAFPVNRWLIARGRGHALVHAHHGC